MLSPNTMLNRREGAPAFLKIDNVATGSTAEIKEPNMKASAAFICVMMPASPASNMAYPVKKVAIRVPGTARSKIVVKFAKKPCQVRKWMICEHTFHNKEHQTLSSLTRFFMLNPDSRMMGGSSLQFVIADQ